MTLALACLFTLAAVGWWKFIKVRDRFNVLLTELMDVKINGCKGWRE